MTVVLIVIVSVVVVAAGVYVMARNHSQMYKRGKNE